MANEEIDLILEKITIDLQNNRLKVHSMPELLNKLSKEMNNSMLTVKDLSNIISTDTGISTQIIRISQTMRYSNPGTTITSIPNAISRIGLKTTLTMSLALALENMFVFRNKTINIFCHQKILSAYQICKYALTISNLVYKELPASTADFIILGSALLNLGTIPFLVQIDQYFVNNKKVFTLSRNDLDECLEKVRIPLSVSMLRHWKFDKSFEQVVTLKVDDNSIFYMNSLAYAYEFIKDATQQNVMLDVPKDLAETITPLTDSAKIEDLTNWLQAKSILAVSI